MCPSKTQPLLSLSPLPAPMNTWAEPPAISHIHHNLMSGHDDTEERASPSPEPHCVVISPLLSPLNLLPAVIRLRSSKQPVQRVTPLWLFSQRSERQRRVNSAARSGGGRRASAPGSRLRTTRETERKSRFLHQVQTSFSHS